MDQAFKDAISSGYALDEPSLIIGSAMREGELFNDTRVQVALSMLNRPGHTAGCVLFSLDYPGHPQITRVVFSGDVLFAGSIGRTDLPGGDPAVMRDTLAGPVLSLPDSAAVLPGHGPQTTMERERRTNPYLQPSFLRTR